MADLHETRPGARVVDVTDPTALQAARLTLAIIGDPGSTARCTTIRTIAHGLGIETGVEDARHGR